MGMEANMKKIKLALIAIVAMVGVGLLAGCGDADTDQTGSNSDPGTNKEESTGVIEEIVTDAATGIEDLATDAADGIENLGNDMKDDNANQTNGADNIEETSNANTMNQ